MHYCICIRTSLAEPLHLIVSPLDPIKNRRTRSIVQTQFSFSPLPYVPSRNKITLTFHERLRVTLGEYSFNASFPTRLSFFEESKKTAQKHLIFCVALVNWIILIDNERLDMNGFLSIGEVCKTVCAKSMS